ncbi:MAG: AraC family transcriptional regulator [Alistipes sp.]|nr:AraC family transcriptional regulator [Alistipes sp.]
MDETTKSSEIKFHYLIPNKSDLQYGCGVNVVGSQVVTPGEVYPAPNHPNGYVFDPERGRVLSEYQLLYIVKGRGTLTTEQGEFPVSKGMMILLRPGQWHTYRPAQEVGWNEYYIGFVGDVAERAIRTLFDEGEYIFSVGLNREIVELYQRAIEVASIDRPAAQQMLAGIVMHMIGVINFTSRNESLSADRLDQIVEQAKSIMQENVMHSIDLEALAAHLNVSYSWFRKIFRDYTGHPPAKYFMEMKLRHAQYMLANTRESIKEIAFMLNFKSTEHFYTTFKRVMGCTPNTYRRMSTPEKGKK